MTSTLVTRINEIGKKENDNLHMRVTTIDQIHWLIPLISWLFYAFIPFSNHKIHDSLICCCVATLRFWDNATPYSLSFFRERFFLILFFSDNKIRIALPLHNFNHYCVAAQSTYFTLTTLKKQKHLIRSN